MNYKFYVITYVPDLLDEDEGNLCHENYYKDVDRTNNVPTLKIGFSESGRTIDGTCKVPVFHVGEIVICDETCGREVCYPGRKPSKWWIEYEIFDNLDDAVKKAQEILYG